MAQARGENIRVRVTAIRALRDAVHLIDEEFRRNPENCQLVSAHS
jgi:UTP:GlnB (protein PII) uridylyltransferase